MKPSVFNVFTPGWLENTFLGFNTFTGSFITLNHDKFVAAQTILNHPEPDTCVVPDSEELIGVLRQGGFVVHDDVDEHAEVEKRYWSARKQRKGVSLTLAPTVACNLRCTYCFEEHPNRKMSQKDIDATVDFVRANLEQDTSLGVVWFGGEPMLAIDQIVDFAPQLKQEAARRNASYHQSIITNGVLFTKTNAKKLASVGPFDSVQITLDGPPRIHDTRRWTVSGAGTFDKILTNIADNADDFNIQIRVNVDRTNYEHLGEFIEILDKAGLNGRVSVYLGHAYSYANTVGDLGSSQLTIEEFASVEAQFKWHLFKTGFALGSALPSPQVGSHCVADNPKGAVISPGGKVFKCWNETAMSADHAVGQISELAKAPAMATQYSNAAGLRLEGAPAQNDAQKKVREGWDNYSPFTQADCKSCRVRPLCMGGCPWEVRQMPSTDGPGHCTSLRFNIEDSLRLYHLTAALNQTVQVGAEQTASTELCQS